MRGIPPRTMCGVWSRWNNKEKVRTIVKYLPRKEEVPKKVDEDLVRQIARGVTEGFMATLGKEMAGKILSSSPAQSAPVKQDDKVQIRETFIDPTEEMDLEHNFERLGKVRESDNDVQQAIRALKSLRTNKNTKEVK